MAITSYGYPGTVNARALSLWLPMVAAAQYSVGGPGDLRVVARAGADRGITIKAGTISGDGIMDVVDADITNLALPAVAGASTVSQWFMVVARRTWGSTNATTFAIKNGTSARQLPARANEKGVQTEQPIALCRVVGGSATITEFVDLRVWGRNGGLFAFDDLARDYLTEVGTSINVGAFRWESYLDNDLNVKWRKSSMGGAIGYARSGPFREPTVTNPLISEITIPYPGFNYHIQAQATVEFGGGGVGTRWNVGLFINGSVVDQSRGDVTAPWAQVKGNSWGGPATGPSKVTLSASRMAGNGAFGVSQYNQFFFALIVPAL